MEYSDDDGSERSKKTRNQKTQFLSVGFFTGSMKRPSRWQLFRNFLITSLVLFVGLSVTLVLYKHSILWYSVRNGNIGLLELALFLGADPNNSGINGPILLYGVGGPNKEDKTRLLLAHGANPNLVRPKADITPLHLAVKQYEPMEVVKLLVEHGASIDGIDSLGYSPLLYSLENNNLDAARYLTERGANLDVCNMRGNTPIYFAATEGSQDFLKYLLSKGARKIGSDPRISDLREYLRKKGQVEILNILETTPGLF